MKMKLKLLAAATLSLAFSSSAFAHCHNSVPIKTLTNAFPAYEIMTSEMQDCGNVDSELDKDHRLKLQPALSANPSLYQQLFRQSILFFYLFVI